jgi:two-component system LytT family response regulator
MVKGFSIKKKNYTLLSKMNEIRTIIIDDELSARNVLSSLLALSFPYVKVIASAENLSDGATLIEKNKPDLVFLDVEMPNYAGYEIVRFFDEINFHIIFITAYNQYAINAFEINAVDYLLKPIERPRLKQAIEKVASKIATHKTSSDYASLLDKLKSKENKTIALSEAGSKHLVNVNKIIAISAQGSYSDIHLENKKMLVSKNIGTLAKELENQDCFIRTHKSWIINKEYIVSYQKGEQTICLQKNIIAKLSRTQKNEFETSVQDILLK